MDLQDFFLFQILLVVVLVALGKFIYNWYAEVGKRNRLMEANIQLLALLAHKKNVKRDALKKILRDSKIEISNELVEALNEGVE